MDFQKAKSKRVCFQLEWIEGQIWANIWYKDCIAIINPSTGNVDHWVLLWDLKQKANEFMPSGVSMDVLNGSPNVFSDRVKCCIVGIAYDAETGRVFVTGKYWPRIYEIKLKPIENVNSTFLDKIRGLCTHSSRGMVY